MPRIAIVQQPPAFLDRTKSLEQATRQLADAAAQGAGLVVFTEVYVPGYPAWIWRIRPGTDMALAEQLHGRLVQQAVCLDTDDLAPLERACREHGVSAVCGVTERDGSGSRGTLYNTVVVIGPDGRMLNRHRKLMPTNPERMVWGFGDGQGLRVVDTPCGRVGTLICWESYMPLARAALYAQGVEIYVAPTYDCGDRWVASTQHIAREGGCWVLGSGHALRAADLPDSMPGKAQLYPDAAEWINQGDSVIVAPGVKIVAGPMRNELGLLLADIDLERVTAARRVLDVAGHYARPDVLRLEVNRSPQRSVRFSDDLSEPSP